MTTLKKLSFALIVAFSAHTLYCDQTDDLLFAIEQGDMPQIKRAISAGADLDKTREEDGHNARSLAITQLIQALESNQNTLLWASIVSLLIPVSAAVNSWQYTAIAALTAAVGYGIHSSEAQGLLEKIRSLGTGKYLMGASALATIGLAYSSKSPYTLIPSVIGTAGLLTLWKQTKTIEKHYDVYTLMNPEEDSNLIKGLEASSL